MLSRRATRGPHGFPPIVNTIGKSEFWDSTAILITWDDSGGWYDHVRPPQLDFDGLGFRVPLMVISPYAKKGYVSHTQYEFGSMLRFAEAVFSLPSLAESDRRANDLVDCFDFEQPLAHLFASMPPIRWIGSGTSIRRGRHLTIIEPRVCRASLYQDRQPGSEFDRNHPLQKASQLRFTFLPKPNPT